MEIKAFTDAAVQGVPLLLVVSGLTLYWGKLGLTGRFQLISAMATGLVLGVLYMAITVVPPAGGYNAFVYWASNAFYGLGLGLAAVGSYEVVKKASSKGQVAAIQKLEAESYMGAAAPKQE